MSAEDRIDALIAARADTRSEVIRLEDAALRGVITVSGESRLHELYGDLADLNEELAELVGYEPGDAAVVR